MQVMGDALKFSERILDTGNVLPGFQGLAMKQADVDDMLHDRKLW
jgi:hypothetical protein